MADSKKDDFMKEYQEYRRFRDYLSSREGGETEGGVEPETPLPSDECTKDSGKECVKDGGRKKDGRGRGLSDEVKAKLGLAVLVLLVVVGLGSSVVNHSRAVSKTQAAAPETPLKEEMTVLLRQIVEQMGIDRADSLLREMERDSVPEDTIIITK